MNTIIAILIFLFVIYMSIPRFEAFTNSNNIIDIDIKNENENENNSLFTK